MTASMNIIVDETENKFVIDIIRNGVLEFNAPYFGRNEIKPFVIYSTQSKNPNEKILGGLCGYYGKKYIRVDLLWVDESSRQKGIGAELLKKLDEFAYAKNCKYIQLDTFDFQARPFYEKFGYVCIGTVDKWIEGHDCYFMRKTLGASTSKG